MITPFWQTRLASSTWTKYWAWRVSSLPTVRCKGSSAQRVVVRELPRAIAGDRMAVFDEKAPAALAADQAAHQFDVRLFEAGQVDVAQQPMEAVGVPQGFGLRDHWARGQPLTDLRRLNARLRQTLRACRDSQAVAPLGCSR